MTRCGRFAVVLLLALAAAGPAVLTAPAQEAGAGDAATRAPKVLLVGIDGVRVDILRRARTPVIDSLAASGFFSDRAFTRDHTVSGPGWSDMLTGVWTAKHGVEGNDFSGNRYAEWPDFLTRIERVRPELVTYAVLDWAPLWSPADGGPLVSDAVDEKVGFDGDAAGYRKTDSLSVEAAVERLRDGPVDAAFVYLGEADVVAHATDSFSPPYVESIERADAQLGALLDAVRARPTYAEEDWLVLVSTDHGRDDAGGHGGDSPSERTIFFLASGPAAATGSTDCPPEIVDVAATALAHLGLGPDPAWGLDGRPRGLVETEAED